MRELASEFSFDVARRGYAVGSAVLGAILPPGDGPTATVPVSMGDEGLGLVDGVEAKAVIVDQLAGALEVIEQHSPARIVTLGGECAVSVAPFSWLARRDGDDMAILWIDSHPDIGTPASEYPGFHAMAVAALTGHGDSDIRRLLPASVSPDRVALVGLHEWTEDDYPNVAEWGIQTFSPNELRQSTQPLLAWLVACGYSRVAIHFDVDTVDSNEIVLGLGAVPDGLNSQQVRRVIADVTAAVDVVGLTIAEFFSPAGHALAAGTGGLSAHLAALRSALMRVRGLRRPGHWPPVSRLGLGTASRCQIALARLPVCDPRRAPAPTCAAQRGRARRLAEQRPANGRAAGGGAQLAVVRTGPWTSSSGGRGGDQARDGRAAWRCRQGDRGAGVADRRLDLGR